MEEEEGGVSGGREGDREELEEGGRREKRTRTMNPLFSTQKEAIRGQFLARV